MQKCVVLPFERYEMLMKLADTPQPQKETSEESVHIPESNPIQDKSGDHLDENRSALDAIEQSTPFESSKEESETPPQNDFSTEPKQGQGDSQQSNTPSPPPPGLPENGRKRSLDEPKSLAKKRKTWKEQWKAL